MASTYSNQHSEIYHTNHDNLSVRYGFSHFAYKQVATKATYEVSEPLLQETDSTDVSGSHLNQETCESTELTFFPSLS